MVYSKTKRDRIFSAQPITEYDVARGILKFQCKTWEVRATSYSVNSKAIIDRSINEQNIFLLMHQEFLTKNTRKIYDQE